MINNKWEKLPDIKSDLHSNIHPAIQQILYHKGITDEAEIREYLSQRPQKTYNPFLMKGMEQVCSKIIETINQNKRIVIYGDYDVDGIAAVALLMEVLQPIAPETTYYIPNRQEEGYGLNENAMLEIKEKLKGNLIISVDCGITSIEEAEYAKKMGMEIIITDHHSPGEILPDCLILNPKQPGCNYPFKDLSGCGIAFKLAQGLQRKLELSKSMLANVLDLVAISAVADVVPLTDENRTLVKYGLKELNKMQRLGIKLLMENINMTNIQVNTGHIGFVIGPHFNASGRVDDARKGVELLMTKNYSVGREIAGHLVMCNRERQELQEAGFEKCVDLIENNYLHDDFIVADVDGIHEGVVGIIAGKIRDRYYKPVLIITGSSEENIYKGSGRSIEGINILNVMQLNRDCFIKLGGHANACGFAIKKERIADLRKSLNLQMKERKKTEPELFVKKIKIYAELKPEDITENLINEINKLEPYGMGNEKPFFLLEQIKLSGENGKRIIGKTGEHIKLTGSSLKYSESEKKVEALGFKLTEYYVDYMNSPDTVDIVFFPQINEWNGCKGIQLLIKDLMQSAINKFPFHLIL